MHFPGRNKELSIYLTMCFVESWDSLSCFEWGSRQPDSQRSFKVLKINIFNLICKYVHLNKYRHTEAGSVHILTNPCSRLSLFPSNIPEPLPSQLFGWITGNTASFFEKQKSLSTLLNSGFTVDRQLTEITLFFCYLLFLCQIRSHHSLSHIDPLISWRTLPNTSGT